MKRILMLFLGAVLALGVLVDRPGPVAATEAAGFCADDQEQAFLKLINDYRAANGVGPLAFSQALGASAEHHGLDMATNDFLGHTGTDGSSFSERFVAHGYTNAGAGGENVFAGDATAAGAFDSWRNSPPHSANMLNPAFTAIGIDRVNNPTSLFGWYWTTTFGGSVDAAACLAGAGQNGQPAGDGGAARNGDNNGTAGRTTDDGAANTGGTVAIGELPGATDADQPPPCVDGEELAFLTLINDHRAANGVGPLTLSPTLSAAAKAHSQDMATKNYFDHTGLDGSTPEQRMTAAGYTGANATGENIFAGEEKASGAMTSWQNSPPHNANMLSPTFTAIGIGRAFDANSEFGWYWTTTFGDKVDAACGGPAENGQTVDGGAGGTGQNGQTGTGDNGTGAPPDNGNGNAESDRDGDGILDVDETDFYGTDPDLFDTDGGGAGDGDEVFLAGTDPFDPSDDNGGGGGGGSDRDGDGLLDDDETGFFGTDPDAFDTDGDGSGDGDEVFFGTDPLDPNDF